MGGGGDEDLQKKIEEYRARERVYLAGLIEQEADGARLRAMATDVIDTYGDRSRAVVRGALAFPTANMEASVLRQKIREQDQTIVLLKEELEANRFDQHSPAGQALMRKCKALLTENRELGEEMREDRMAELLAVLQVEQRQNSELHQKVNEASDFCRELSDENVKLQGTIARVAHLLREGRAELDRLMRERAEAKKRRKIEKEAKAIAAQMKAQASLGGALPEHPAAAAAAEPAEPAEDGEIAAEPALAVVGADMQLPDPADGSPGAAAKDRKKREKKDKSRKRKAEEIAEEGK